MIHDDAANVRPPELEEVDGGFGLFASDAQANRLPARFLNLEVRERLDTSGPKLKMLGRVEIIEKTMSVGTCYGAARHREASTKLR